MKESRITANTILIRKKDPKTMIRQQKQAAIMGFSAFMRLYMVFDQLSLVRIWNTVKKARPMLSKVRTPLPMKTC